MRFTSRLMVCVPLAICLSACAGEEPEPEMAVWSALSCDSGEMSGAFGVDDPSELRDCVRARMDQARADDPARPAPRYIDDLDAAEACLAEAAGLRSLGRCLFESGAIPGPADD